MPITNKLLLLSFLAIGACRTGTEIPTPDSPNVSIDTAFNAVRIELLAPDENHVLNAYKYKQGDAGFNDLKYTEFSLKDSANDGQYRLRFYSKGKHLEDSSYSYTPDKQNNYPDKVYVEFYRYGENANEHVYASELQQSYGYLKYQKDSLTVDKVISFKFLSKEKDSDRFNIVSGLITYY